MSSQRDPRMTHEIIPWAVSGQSQHGPTQGVGVSDGPPGMIFSSTFPQVNGPIRTIADIDGHRRRTGRPVSRMPHPGRQDGREHRTDRKPDATPA